MLYTWDATPVGRGVNNHDMKWHIRAGQTKAPDCCPPDSLVDMLVAV